MKGSLCPEAQGLRARRHRPPHEPILTPAAITRRKACTVMAPPNTQDHEDQPSVILPPLLALPLEIKLQILSNFDDDTDDGENGLTLMVLRRTHKSFRQIIPNPWNRSSPERKKRRYICDHWLAAECKYPYLFPLECDCEYNDCPQCHSNDCPNPFFLFFPCYDCRRLVDRGDFGNYRIAYFRDERFTSYKSATLWDLMGGEHAKDRLCDRCWKEQLKDPYETTTD